MSILDQTLHKQNKLADAKRYRDASAKLQEILLLSPLEIAQALDRRCPFCLHWLEPRVLAVKIAGHAQRRQAIFPDRCGCLKEQAAIAAEVERRNKTMDCAEQVAWRSNLQRAGLVGWLARATFDTYRERHDWGAAAQVKGCCASYADAVIHRKLNSTPWLVLYGAYGCGKSHLAAAVCHETMAHGLQNVFFRPWGQYLDRLMATFDRQAWVARTSDVMRELQHGKLVVIDDLDKQPRSRSGWAESKLFTILNYRYNANLPTVITLNAAPEILGGPIGDRLIGAAFDSVVFDGPSFRGQ